MAFGRESVISPTSLGDVGGLSASAGMNRIAAICFAPPAAARDAARSFFSYGSTFADRLRPLHKPPLSGDFRRVACCTSTSSPSAGVKKVQRALMALADPLAIRSGE